MLRGGGRLGLVIVLFTAAAIGAVEGRAVVAGRGAASADERPALRFGAYVPPAPEQGIGAVASLQRTLGRPIDVVLWYQQWGAWGRDFMPSWVSAVTDSGRAPLLTWEPWTPGSPEQPKYRLRRIARGDFDRYLRGWGRALAAFGRPVYLRPMHEMNGNWYPWGGTVNGNTAADYVAAWRRMWSVFRQVGATNVRWVWSPLVDDVPATAGNRFERYYPGGRYVDVLALDGYNWGGDFPQYGGWRPFGQLFSPAYERISRLGPQPVWIAETASAPEGGDKAEWVRDMLSSVALMPRVETIVWFSVNKERDWRADSSPEVAAAFAAG